MSQRFAVVHEAEADFQTATELADRVLVDAIDWLDDSIANQRDWIGVQRDHRLSWTAIPKLAREINIRARGHFDGEPGQPDAAAARRALLYLLATVPDVSAILLIRDQDDQPERRNGLEQARRNDRSGTAIVIGLAVVEREAWVISGFEPRVLRQLCSGDRNRERDCWTTTPLDQLKLGAVYTRYADDLAFSGSEQLERSARRLQIRVAVIAAEEGFELHFRKSRFMRQGVCQQLGGVVVNERLNVPRQVYDELKAILTNCARHGPNTQNRASHPDFRGHLLGRIAYVQMIHPERGAKLRRLFERIEWPPAAVR